MVYLDMHPANPFVEDRDKTNSQDDFTGFTSTEGLDKRRL